MSRDEAAPAEPRGTPAAATCPVAVSPLLPLAAVFVLGLAAYANACGGGFVFDDLRHVRDNLAIRDLGAIASWSGLLAFRHRWVAYLTFALNYRAGGLSPAGYHAVNVAVHLANAALVFALVVLAFRAPRLAASTLAPHARAIGFVAAALFVAHPIQTQAVTYVVQRMTSLATLFYLAAVVLYLHGRLAGPARSRAAAAATYAAVLVASLLAMRTKEIAFTLPFAIALVELSLLEPARRDLLALVPILATAAIVPVTWLAGAPASVDAVTRVQTDLGRLDYLATELAVIVSYLSLVLLPVGQSLDHEYPIHRSFLAPEVLSALVVLAALAGLTAFLHARTRASARRPLDPAARLAALGIAWWFLALSVESSLIPIVDVINEHRVYLPSVGVFVAVAVAVAFAARRLSAPAAVGRRTAAAGALAALVLVPVTFARNRVWADDVSLWTDAARKAPGKGRPLLNLGTALREAGRPAAAIAALRRGLELDPGSSYGHAQLGALLLQAGRRDEAEPELRAVLAVAPQDPEALFNLATLMWETGRTDEARPIYARFVAVAPEAYGQVRRLAAARGSAPIPAAPVQ